MNGVSVEANGKAVPLLFVSPNQINFLLPFETQSASRLIVNYAGRESSPLQLGPDKLLPDAAPAIFTISADQQGAVLLAGTELIAGPARDKVSRPAGRGEVIEVYCTGLGPVSNPPAAGRPAADSLSSTLGNTIVTVGTVRARGVVFGPCADRPRRRLSNQRQDSTRRASGRSRAAIRQCQRTGTRKQHGTIAVQ